MPNNTIDLQEYGQYRAKVDRLTEDCYEGDEPVVKTFRDYMAIQADRDKQAGKRLVLAGLFLTALVGLIEWRPWHHDPAPVTVVPVSAEPNNYDSMRHENREKQPEPQRHSDQH